MSLTSKSEPPEEFLSRQLGFLWKDIDLDCNIITIRRVQERDGSTTD